MRAEHGCDSYSRWDDFDAIEYVERNYGNGISPADRQIIEFVISEMEGLGVGRTSLLTVADVGSGPNLYPALIASSYLADGGVIDLIDAAPLNRTYMRRLLDGRDERGLELWQEYEEYIRSLGVAADFHRVVELSNVIRGDIHAIASNSYDAALSFFVGESIGDSLMDFRKATESLIGSVKRGGIFVAAHIIGSDGYYAGTGTRFPATNLTIEQVRDTYDRYGSCRYHVVAAGDDVVARKGRLGMMVAVGRKVAG
ncbi:hypothetical protein JK358_38350 [Nocardia sp. 2]|uniref:Methyltransferase n=1 Tax=Nocardia acididurans TaxID=2802282 RepID=A0ABS1MKU2_9NOCA|nr:hypothetical protein [Nocardia acididurans]MBL1080274.1 hypothetical protein [Nocardia acididurans]